MFDFLLIAMVRNWQICVLENSKKESVINHHKQLELTLHALLQVI